MSSHREAPEISKDPVADSTDLYAFVSPDAPDTVTLIANYIPLQAPAAGPNFFEFGDDVLYEIHIDHDGDGRPEVTYQFRFTTTVADQDTFLYNTGQILSLDSPNWNRKQTYSVVKVDAQGRETLLGDGLRCPPCNVGPRSIPDYAALAQEAVHRLGPHRKVFAGQRAEGFYVDLGSIFDLGDLRPFQNLHLIPTPAAPGVDATAAVNVHSIALQVPIHELTKDGWKGTNEADPRAVIGVWTTASRRKAVVREVDPGRDRDSGPYVQVSRLGNPLVNEVLIPMARKDEWNSLPPGDDKKFAQYVANPELAALLNVLYPGQFPNLAAFVAGAKPRADLLAILLTGIPSNVITGFQNYTGPTQADMLRLNVAIPPNPTPDNLGLLGPDLSGYPNGRRPADDVVTIELRAIAGLTLPLVEAYTPDPAASVVSDFEPTQPAVTPVFMPNFPYLNQPYSGFDVPA